MIANRPPDRDTPFQVGCNAVLHIRIKHSSLPAEKVIDAALEDMSHGHFWTYRSVTAVGKRAPSYRSAVTP
jgi:hypothetical protein